MQRNLAEVSCAKRFFPSSSEKAMKMFASFPTHGMDASKSSNRIVHFKTVNKFNASLGLDLGLNWKVLSHVLWVTSIFKHNLEKVRKTLAGHFKSADGPHVARGLDSTAIKCVVFFSSVYCLYFLYAKYTISVSLWKSWLQSFYDTYTLKCCYDPACLYVYICMYLCVCLYV